ncbi:phage major capsid protein [Rhizobium rhizogenes]|uniref:Capsid protein n=1 Tax=Rhizobium rhizogenes NBRC 13257 TaxID=1220581 RepID=A0AA87UAD9_RHIRH|nr:phage major capsid protein [Rhizobium rhizogenes]NTG65388.1 phage major capsid protein [Rhizobium rhizogenes]NTI66252.1 phage major capsid protein [Rhizobium rhizogenes]TRB11025.1 phage major capsid protein [Rhizobium rhizogenes]TRB41824.1 phage major capsid protein [Rhizobium rhizogenes]TRB58690.1 phage major capsid protein [Rhizobium rhizogenes]
MSVHARMPRAIGRIYANSPDPARVVAALQAGFEDFKRVHNDRTDNFQKAVDDLNAKIAGVVLNGPGGRDDVPIDPEYSGVFSSWFRYGDADDSLKASNRAGLRQQIHAAMSAGSASDGGYLAPVEWDRKVLQKLATVSPMRRLAMVVPTGVRGYSTVWNAGGWGSGWIGETAARPETGTPTLSPLTFMAGEIYANPAITANLLDDADFDAGNWLADQLADEFSKQEGVAFISGDGVNKPNGLLTYATGGAAAALHPGGAIEVVNSGSAAAVTPDGLIDFVYKLPSPYRQGASWLMSSTTAAAIRKLKDGQDNYLWEPSYSKDGTDTLLGYPVEIDENMPSIAADAIPVAFGNFKRGYVVNDRQGTRILRDPYTNKPYVNFYTTKRVGGGVNDPNAFKFLKIGA